MLLLLHTSSSREVTRSAALAMQEIIRYEGRDSIAYRIANPAPVTGGELDGIGAVGGVALNVDGVRAMVIGDEVVGFGGIAGGCAGRTCAGAGDAVRGVSPSRKSSISSSSPLLLMGAAKF